jgi:UDP-N-acetylmuramate--alanine ligase
MIKTKDILFQKTVHFIGIGGAGMIALAQYLRSFGNCKVTGTDLKKSPALKELAKHGFSIFDVHDEKHVKKADFVVFSTAVSEDNPELAYARQVKIPCYRRSEFLALLMKDYKQIVSISGAHGKTTSTGLAIHILDSAGIIPSFMIGGELAPYYVNGRYSESSTFVTEADESDGSFLNLIGDYALITNIDLEHMNYYKSEENLMASFLNYANKTIEKDGFLSLNLDDKRIKSIIHQIHESNFYCISVLDKAADLFADAIVYTGSGTSFDLYFRSKLLGTVSLNLFGKHNVYNALSVIALMLKMNVPFSHIQKGCKSFKGVKRRLQFIGKFNGASIYDDYGHHPTEVRATLAGIKSVFKGHVTCVFQPHRITRVQQLLTEFQQAFGDADTVIVMPVYAANEEGDSIALSKELAKGIQEFSQIEALYLESFEAVQLHLKQQLSPDDIVITMGAGDISKLGPELVAEKMALKKPVMEASYSAKKGL